MRGHFANQQQPERQSYVYGKEQFVRIACERHDKLTRKDKTVPFIRYVLPTLLALTKSSALFAQEASARGSDVQEDTRAIAIQMDAKNAAVLSILQMLTTCNAKRAFYQPTDTSADADGCVWPSAVGLTLMPAGEMNIPLSKGTKTLGPLSADVCLLTGVVTSAYENTNGSCSLSKSAAGWSLTARAAESRSKQGCTARCYNFE